MTKKLFLRFILLISLTFIFLSCKKNRTAGEEPETPQEASSVLLEQALNSKKTLIRAGFVPGVNSLPFLYFLDNKPSFNNFILETERFNDSSSLLSAFLKGRINFCIFDAAEVHKILSLVPDSLVIAGSAGRQKIFLCGSDVEGDSFSFPSSLKNRTVYIAGESSYESLLFNFLLKKNTLTSGDEDGQVKCVYSSALTRSAFLTDGGEASFAVLSEPFACAAVSKNRGGKKLIELTSVYSSASGLSGGGELILCLKKDFAKNNPQVLSFLQSQIKLSLSFLSLNPHRASSLAVKNSLFVTEKTAFDTITGTDFVFMDALQTLTELDVLFEGAGLGKGDHGCVLSF